MSDTMRTCRRTGCRWPAAASLAFCYETGQVWLLDLVAEPDPSVWDLCPHHADTLTVPRGWDRVDDRSLSVPPVEPAGRDLVARRAPVLAGVGAGRTVSYGTAPGSDVAGSSDSSGGQVSRPAAGRARVNRYAALTADLPRVAAELAASGGLAADAPPEARAVTPPPPQDGQRPSARAGAPARTSARARPAVVPSRDLAPLPPELSEPAPGADSGQMTIPVSLGDATGPDAVVVSIGQGGRRSGR